jgi:hypothetical protein
MSVWRLPLPRWCRPHPVFRGPQPGYLRALRFLAQLFLGTGKLSSNAGFVRDGAVGHSADRDRLNLEPLVFLKTNPALAE